MFYNLFTSCAVNLKGNRISSRVVVIESDDWGSVRMPSVNKYLSLIELGIPVNRSLYCKYDGLELNSDIEALLGLLHRINSRYKKKVIITLNFVTANPDFIKIKEIDFSNYFSECILETYRKYPGSENVISKVNQGVANSYFLPQFHGREHINVQYWMSLLKSDKNFRLACENNVCGLSTDIYPELEKSVQATYDTLDVQYQNNSITEGLGNFERIFGFRSRSFISNNYILSETSFLTLKSRGIEVIQGMKYQKLPKQNNAKKRRHIRRSFGEVDSVSGIKFTVRNCTFEPTEIGDTVESTIQQVRIAFLMKKPAVISTHRINFTSRLSIENRDKNLIEFERLLVRIIEEWPDVQFMTSIEALELK